jgi:hypothetical protein
MCASRKARHVEDGRGEGRRMYLATVSSATSEPRKRSSLGSAAGPRSGFLGPCGGSGSGAQDRAAGDHRAAPGLPAPVELEALAVPSKNGRRLNNEEAGPPVPPEA